MTTAETPVDVASSTLRERKKLQTRQAIHDAATRLISERGLAGVTVDAICVEADVSSRTFFNYFPSKSAAALGLPGGRIDDEVRTRFLAGDDLVGDLCDLVARTMGMRDERARMKDLVSRRPELVPAMLQWMNELRSELCDLAAERSDEQTARRAVVLVLAALTELVHRTAIDSRVEVAAELRVGVAALGVLARTVRTG